MLESNTIIKKWETVQILLSLAVTEGIGYNHSPKDGYCIDHVDVRRAYFNAPSQRSVFVELPPEDYCQGMCGRLHRSMYGSRDTAQNLEIHYNNVFTKLGFIQGNAVSCAYYHKSCDIRATIHGDDIIAPGDRQNLDWLRHSLRQEFEIKASRIGPSDQDDKTIKVLNRIVTWTDG